jgi:hypothetical protein
MNRADVIRQILLWERVAEQATARAAAFRQQLQANAVAELTEQGTAPSWRSPEVGLVFLPVSKTAPVVTDHEALAKWVSLTRPSEVEMRVRPAYVKALRDGARIEGDVVTDRDGTVIPGMEVRPGGNPGSVTFTPETPAREAAAEAAGRVLDLVAVSLHLPPPDFDADGEVAGDDVDA